MHPKHWAIPEKIDEFDPVFPSKDRKGMVLKPGVAYRCIFLKMGYSTKY